MNLSYDVSDDDEFNMMAVDSRLDNSAARHKLSVKPKKNHLSASQLRRSVSPQPAAAAADIQIANSCQLGQILKSASANDKYVYTQTPKYARIFICWVVYLFNIV